MPFLSYHEQKHKTGQSLRNCLSISIITAIFPREPGLATFIGAKDDDRRSGVALAMRHRQ